MAFCLAGKTIIVTGASRGIGAEAGWALASQGPAAIVVGFASHGGGAEERTTAIREKHGDDIALHAVSGVVNDQPSAQAVAKAAFAALDGELDILVNVAGVMHPTPFAMLGPKESEDHFSECTGTDFFGPLFLTQPLAPHIRVDGRVIFTSSALTSESTSIPPGAVPYPAAGDAIERSRANRHSPALNDALPSNVVAPGPINPATFAANVPESALAPPEAHPSAGERTWHLSLCPWPALTAVRWTDFGHVRFPRVPGRRWVNGQTMRVSGEC
jgi:NAD(P)-dependent dehydrogenase (short-subunit alcohol dehydrogenase family)